MSERAPHDLDDLSAGEVIEHCKDAEAQATQLMHECVKAVRATGRKGSVTLVVKFEERNKTTHELGVAIEVRSSPPNRNTLYSLYSDEKGRIATEPEDHLFTGHDAEAEDGER